MINRTKPQKRIEQPFSLKTPPVYRTLSFQTKRTNRRKPIVDLTRKREVFPNKINRKSNELLFDANFECANLESASVIEENVYSLEIYKDNSYPRQWFFFKASNFHPGWYTFIINGLNERSFLFSHNISPVALSESLMNIKGIGWMRISKRIRQWRVGPKNWSLSFSFHVRRNDTMYFAYSYPYTFTMLKTFLSQLPQRVHIFYSIKTTGKIPIPMIFWDSDRMKCVDLPENIDSFPTGIKPMIIFCARHHPGETPGSFAMEGFISRLFSKKKFAIALRKRFSFLIIPMINIDGVVCGFFRPGLRGTDYNRIWKDSTKQIQAKRINKIVDKLSESRNIVFFLDFHGHRRQWDSFIYSCYNEQCPMNEYAMTFPLILSKICPIFDYDQSINFDHTGGETIMRVEYHNRYWIPFSYTLEMSFGGSKLVKPLMQFTPNDYRQIGRSTVSALYKFFIENQEISTKITKYYSTKSNYKPLNV